MGYTPDYQVRSQVVTKIRDKIIANLRRLLTTDPKYTYVELPNGEYDFTNTKVIISDIFPQDHIFYPAIIVNTTTSAEDRYIGPDTNQLVKNGSHVVTDDLLFDSFVSTVNINVYTIDDSLSRDVICDILYNNFKYTNTDLAEFGIEIIRTSFPTFAGNYAEGRWYFTGNLTMELYSEWNGSLGSGTTMTQTNVSVSLEA